LEVQQRRVVRPYAPDAEDVWADVLAQDANVMTRLSTAMRTLLYEPGGRVPHWLARIATAWVYPWLQRNGGRFLAETDHLADRIGVLSRAQMAFAQRQYTLAHAGCSTAVVWNRDLHEFVCFRSLDWPAADHLGEASRIFEWQGEQGQTLGLAAGVVGMVGALTVARPGWCAVINASPMRRSIWPGEDPTFLLRDAVIDASLQTYDDALRRCMSWKPSSAFFLTLAGPKEACVLEYGRRTVHTRRTAHEGLLVQTNHHEAAGPFAGSNPKAQFERTPAKAYALPLMASSCQRFEHVSLQLGRPDDGEPLLEALQRTWATPPLWNHETAQWVYMRPATGEMRLWVFESEGLR
jgi:hypothetical protein